MIKTICKNIRVERLNILALFSVAVLTLTYLLAANSASMVNYQKIVLLKSIGTLRMEIRALNLELTGKQSIGFLKKAAEDLNLVVNESIQYIKIAGPVAKNP